MITRKLTVAGVLAAAIMGLTATGIWFYRSQERQLLDRVESELGAVAQLKVGEIVAWREDRLDEANELLARPWLSSRLAACLARGGSDSADILAEFRVLQEFDHYRQIQLADRHGRVVLGLADPVSSHAPEVAAALAECLASNRPIITDLHTDSDTDSPHVTVVAPVVADGAVLGAVYLISDARNDLFPMIQRWPTPSPSAETLLVRRDGDQVVFLNELRHRRGAAMSLRMPLSQAFMPAVKAVTGTEGIVRGRDYRGIDVLASVRHIPDSPWYLVSKVDAAEAMAVWRMRSALILAAWLAAIAAVASAGYSVWQNARRAHVQALYDAEASRRRSEERYLTTLQSIGDGVIVTDAQGHVQLLNPVAETLTGWSDDQAKGHPLEEVFGIINEETRQTVASPVARVLAEGTIVGLANHTVLVGRDGCERPIADSGAPIRDEYGQIAGVVLVFRDQTDERAAQDALRASEILHHSTVSALAEGVMVFATDGEVLACNPAAEKILGLTRQTMTQRRQTLANWSPLRADGSPFPVTELPVARTLATGEACHDVELGDLRPDGSVTWLLVSSEPLRASASTPVTAAVVSFTDITARKAAVEALQVSEQRFRLTLESAPEAIFVQTRGCFAYANATALSLFGAAGPEELVGMRVLDRFHPDFHAEIAARIARLNEGHEQVSASEKIALRFDGSPVDVEVSAAPIVYDGEHGAVVFVRDITARKGAAEERARLQNDLAQAQKMESVGRLAGGVAHDFNNMLGVIIGHAELALLQTATTDPNREHLTTIQSAAVRSADLTRQLLAFARKQTVAPKVVDLDALIPETLKMLRRLISEDIDLSWRPGTDTWPVLIDPAQLDQILTNLAVNARDAIGGVGTITIETGNLVFDADYCAHHAGFIPGPFVMLAVSDDGEGMDRDVVAHLFEPFFTTKALGQGTGLGLATVYGVVKQNGGFINVYSEPAKGTTFKLYFPRSGSPADGRGPATLDVAPLGDGEVVLLVEDEPALLVMTREMLEGLGYDVVTAASPAEAIQFAAACRQDIHLLVTDVVMPELNGRLLSNQLRAFKPGLKCLFMSGYTPNAIAHRGVLDDGVQFLQKPFSRQDLATKVRDALAAP